MSYTKLDTDAISELRPDQCCSPETIGPLQVAVYVMAGGGIIGRLAAEQPADFYVDSRVGRRPYPMGALCQAVKVLAALAEVHGLDPHHMPPMPRFHGCGIF